MIPKFKKVLAILLVLVMVIGVLPTAAFALTISTVPSGGTTSANPFLKGTGGSNSFRIPALVTLSDGTLVAAADVRWNTTYDGGGLDTIVSYSTDNGANWAYSFANYLGDNGNVYSGNGSTAFIDPALAVTENDTIYMLCDLYPYGVALNGSGNTAPSTSLGLNDDGTLKLAEGSSSSYSYYLKNGTIYSSSGTAVSGLTVDTYFNVKGTYNGTAYDTNLFFSDSPFKVVRTGYLYLTKSTDKGKTWSAPTLLNLKTSSEQACLVAPGRATVTSDGTIIFPCYSYNGSADSQRVSFIYSQDNGASWQRSDSLSYGWGSESECVELGDGTLRFFFRNGNSVICYADAVKSGNSYTWQTPVTTSVAVNSNTQISAIKYSKTIDGKTAILVSCPTGSGSTGSSDSSASARLNGKIFVGLINDDGSMTWKYSMSVPSVNSSNQFMYSCLTELSGGDIAILYEDNESKWGTGDDCYYQMSFKKYAITDITGASAVIGKENKTLDAETSMTVNTSQSLSVGTSASWTTSNEAVVSLASNDGVSSYAAGLTATNVTATAVSAGTATITAETDTAVYTVDITVKSADGTQDIAYDKLIELTVGEEKTETDNTGNYEESYTGSGLDGTVASVTVKGTTTETVGKTYWELVTNGADGIEAGEKYLIVSSRANGSAYALNANGTRTSVTISGGQIASANSNCAFTFEANGSGYNLKDNVGTYLYPDATRSWWSWSYGITSKSATANAVTISGSSSVKIGRSVTSGANSTNSYINLSNQNNLASNRGSNIYLYKYVEEPGESTNKTDITFKGEGVGTTYVTVGSTVYKIVVSPKTENVTLKPGGAVTYTVAAGSTVGSEINTSVATAVVNGTTLTITGVSEGDTSVLVDGTKYNIMVRARGGAQGSITIDEGDDTTITIPDLESGEIVEWSVSDSSKVGVAGVYDIATSSYGAAATVVGLDATEADAPVTVTGTVKNANGNVLAVYTWLVTVNEKANTNTSSKYIYVNVTQIQDCTVYYSINGGELIEINGTGILIDEQKTGLFNIMFFAAPDDGYALTYMCVTGSAAQYYQLSNGNPDGTGSDAWPFISASQTTIPSSNSDATVWKTVNGALHGFRWPLLEGNMSINQMKVLFSNAIALGCDGVTSFTKNGNDSFYTEVQFVAQPLPTLKKDIVSITHNGTTKEYAEGMSVELGDTINYEITITRPKYVTGEVWSGNEYTVTSPITGSNGPTYTSGNYGEITYSNESLTDELTGNAGITNPDLGTSTANDEIFKYTTYVTLTLENSGDVINENGTIINTAELEYTYKSKFSTGTGDAIASVQADEIQINYPKYVIDFGLPVVIDVSGISGVLTITGARAMNSYGTVAFSGTTFTYTPTRALAREEVVELTFSNGGKYAVIIYPASSVYYEESFAVDTDGSWTKSGSVSYGNQTTSAVGAKVYYGFDGAYSGQLADTNGTCISSGTFQDAVTFEFTGTGVDIYARATQDSGRTMVAIKNSAGSVIKLYTVDTKVSAGLENPTEGQTGTYYNIPIVSASGLDYGTYTVEISVAKTSVTNDDGTTTRAARTIYIDGFKVYDLSDTFKDIYSQDNEYPASLVEMRNSVLTGINVAEENELAAKMSQVLDSTDGTGILYITNNSSGKYTGLDQDALNDMLANGPKNEIYLWSGDTIAFNVSGTFDYAQLGLKAVSGTAASVTVNSTGVNVNSTADMYYQVTETADNAFVITNNGSGVVAITDLKLINYNTADDTIDNSGAPRTLYLSRSTAVAAFALYGMTEEAEPEYADAQLNIELKDKRGNIIASGLLTANGEAGTEHVFTAGEIETAVKEILPKNYTLSGVRYADTTVVYGESGTVEFQAKSVNIFTIFFDSIFNRWFR